MPEPLIIGHRGASAIAPENTLIAFERAIEAGADGIEFDVQLARDGVPVVVHDSTLKRTGMRRDAIADLSSTELKRVDVGSWFNLRFPKRARPEYSTTTVPLLADVFDLLRDSSAALYVELKCIATPSRPLAKAVADLIGKYELGHRATVVSFSLDAIKEIKQIDHAIRTGALFEPKLTRPFPARQALIARALRYDVDEILWHRSMARPSCIDHADQNGLRSTVWTADRPSWVARARRDGIHAIITNDPEGLVRARDQSSSGIT